MTLIANPILLVPSMKLLFFQPLFLSTSKYQIFLPKKIEFWIIKSGPSISDVTTEKHLNTDGRNYHCSVSMGALLLECWRKTTVSFISSLIDVTDAGTVSNKAYICTYRRYIFPSSSKFLFFCYRWCPPSVTCNDINYQRQTLI